MFIFYFKEYLNYDFFFYVNMNFNLFYMKLKVIVVLYFLKYICIFFFKIDRIKNLDIFICLYFIWIYNLR